MGTKITRMQVTTELIEKFLDIYCNHVDKKIDGINKPKTKSGEIASLLGNSRSTVNRLIKAYESLKNANHKLSPKTILEKYHKIRKSEEKRMDIKTETINNTINGVKNGSSQINNIIHPDFKALVDEKTHPFEPNRDRWTINQIESGPIEDGYHSAILMSTDEWIKVIKLVNNLIQRSVKEFNESGKIDTITLNLQKLLSPYMQYDPNDDTWYCAGNMMLTEEIMHNKYYRGTIQEERI